MSNSKKFKVGCPVKIVGTVHNGVQGKIIRVLPVGSKSYVVASAKDGSTALQYVGTFNKSNLEHNPLPCNGVKQSPSSTQYEVDDAVRFIAPNHKYFGIEGRIKTYDGDTCYFHSNDGRTKFWCSPTSLERVQLFVKGDPVIIKQGTPLSGRKGVVLGLLAGSYAANLTKYHVQIKSDTRTKPDAIRIVDSNMLDFDKEVIDSLNKEFTPVNNLSDLSEDAFYDVWDEMPPKAPKTDAVKLCGTHNVPIKDAGLQTHIEARFDCLDPSVMKLLAECRGFGVSKYGVDSHKKIPVADHLNHAINHINEHRRGNDTEMHLVNAMCRLLFAISGVFEIGYYEDTYWHPDMGSKNSDKLPNPVSGEKKK
jgi:hypothetical protein